MTDNYNPNEVQSTSQAKKILAYMQEGNRITDLRGEGYDIKSRFVKTPTGKSVKEYWVEDITC